MAQCFGFRALGFGLGFWVRVLRFSLELWFTDLVVGFRVWGLKVRVRGFDLEIWDLDFGLGVFGLRFRIFV